MIAAGTDARPADLYRAERFLIREARLLDERDYAAWLDTLHDDLDYIVFNRHTLELRPRTPASVVDEFQAPGGLQFAEESKESLTYKVGRIDSGLTFSEIPAGRTVRLVTNVEVGRDDSGAFSVESCLHCNRTRKEDRVEDYYARRRDVLVEEEGILRLRRRHVFLNESLLSASTLAIFF